MSVGSLKQVELTHAVTNLGDVPYLKFGQKIQSKRNLMRYWTVIRDLLAVMESDPAAIRGGAKMPLPSNSFINILVNDPNMDFYVPRFITFPKTGAKVDRFSFELHNLKNVLDNSFKKLIRKIRAELNVEGDTMEIPASRLGLGGKEGAVITLNPNDAASFVTSCGAVIGVKTTENKIVTEHTLGSVQVYSYNINLPYFSS